MILISCLVAVVAVIPCVYLVLKKVRKRPATTNVTVFSQGAPTGITGGASAAMTTRAAVLEMQPGSALGATAMDTEAGPCPYKAPGSLPPYYTLECERQEKEKDEPPPSYDDAVKPAIPLE